MKGLLLAALLAIGLIGATAEAARLFKSGTRAATAGARAGDATAPLLRGLGATDKAVAALARWERRNLDHAMTEFLLRSPPNRSGDFLQLERIARQVRAEGVSGRSVALNSNAPWLRIRLARSAAFDAVIRRFAQARLEESLALPFDARKLRVVTLGLSDDAARSASEALRFQRGLPPAARDQFGPLARLGEIQTVTHSERVAMLAPYSGKTVVVVGHIPEARQSFFAFARDGSPVPIDMRVWMEAAAEARVNLVPIGCNSARVAPLGAQGLINSDNVLRRLRRVIADEPRTIGDFLRSFSGQDLILVADPFDLRLFSSGLTFMDRIDGVALARIALRAAEPAGISSPTVPRVDATAAFDHCFAAPNAEAYAACEQGVRHRVARLDSVLRERELEANRRQSLAAVTAGIPAQKREVAAQLDLWRRHAFFFVIAALLLAFPISHAHLGARDVEEEQGASWASLGGRASIQRTMWDFANLGNTPSRDAGVVLLLFAIVVAGAVALWAGRLSTHGLWFALFVGAGIGVAINYLAVAVRDRRVWPVLAAFAILAAALTAGGVAETGKALVIKEEDLQRMLFEQIDLRTTDGLAQWRSQPDNLLALGRNENVRLPGESPLGLGRR